MASPTLVLIASNIVGAGGVTSVNFTSIPQTYTDLSLKVSVRNASGNTDMLIGFNGDSSAIYSGKLFYASGSGAASTVSNSGSTQINWGGLVTTSTQTANTFANNEIYIPNYTAAVGKPLHIDSVQENGASASYQELSSGLWASNAAITSILFTISGQTIAQYSSFYLYGIKNS